MITPPLRTIVCLVRIARQKFVATGSPRAMKTELKVTRMLSDVLHRLRPRSKKQLPRSPEKAASQFVFSGRWPLRVAAIPDLIGIGIQSVLLLTANPLTDARR